MTGRANDRDGRERTRGRISSEEIATLRTMLPQVLHGLGVEDLRRPFRCPSPDHEDRTPSAHYYAAGQVVKCFGCGGSWDVFDLAGMVAGIDGFPDRVRLVADIVGMELESDGDGASRRATPRLAMPPQGGIEAPEPTHEMDAALACQEAYLRLYTREGDYARSWLHRRGIDDDQILRCGLGLAVVPTDIAPEFAVREPAAVFVSIPYWDETCDHASYAVLRTVCPRRHRPRRKEWRPKGVSSPLWREHLLSGGLDVLCVCEGPIDAIALESRLGLPTMALGGTGMARRLARTLAQVAPSERPRCVLLALDDDKPGRDCADALAGDLAGLGVPHASLPGYGGHKDPDDWLMAENGVTWHYREEPVPGLRVPRRTIVWDESPERPRVPYDMGALVDLARANLRAARGRGRDGVDGAHRDAS